MSRMGTRYTSETQQFIIRFAKADYFIREMSVLLGHVKY
jgi:hypothetical protein